MKLVADRREEFMQLWATNFGPDGVNFANYIIEDLDTLGYFIMSASTKYHGAEEGGLFRHSVLVAENLMELTAKNGLTWRNPMSPLKIGLLHDLCKVDRYVLGEADDAEYQPKRLGVPAQKVWKYNEAPSIYGPGHGSKSVIIASSLCSLTEEEALCIRFHMGAYETKEWNEYSSAIDKYPNVLWTHMADMIASHIKHI